MHRFCLLFVGILCVGCLFPFNSVCGQEDPPEQPNIVLLIADDLGWGDLGCYGSQWLKTPNIDAMAMMGCRFTDYYCVSPKCSPSRASILTGRYPARRRVHNVIRFSAELNAESGTVNHLNPLGSQMGKMFQRRGYQTGYFGKWHLGSHPNAPTVEEYGFDDAKTFASRHSTWHPIQTPNFNQTIDGLINQEAIRFVNETQGAPFLAIVSYSTPHAPLNPTEAQMQPYSGFGTNRYPHANANQIYGGAITELDRLVGELVGSLPNNTIVIFTSDNGPVGQAAPAEENPIVAGHHGVGSAGPFRGGKNTVYEGGIRVPFVAYWPGVVPAGVTNATQLSSLDLLPTLLSLADLSYPNVTWDGQDMSDAFGGEFVERTEPLFFEYRYGSSSPVMAIVDGNFKLLANRDGSRKELYDLSTELGKREVDQFDSEVIRGSLYQTLLNWRNGLPDSPIDPDAGKLEWDFPDYSSP